MNGIEYERFIIGYELFNLLGIFSENTSLKIKICNAYIISKQGIFMKNKDSINKDNINNEKILIWYILFYYCCLIKFYFTIN